MRYLDGHNLCQTVQDQSRRIWNDLQDAERLDVPYHEDTITQSLVLDLSRRHPKENCVYVLNSNEESRYGSDFVWFLFSHDLNQHLRVAVQAKRLYSNGRYVAFESSQVKNIKAFADKIGGQAIYLTYNYPRIFQSLHNIWIYGQPHWQSLTPDYQRDLGLLYCYAKDIDNVSSRQLKPTDFAHYCFPMWWLCCKCLATCPRDPLGNLILAMSLGVDHRNLPNDGLLHATPEFLQLWMTGETMQEDELLEMLHLNSIGENFSDESEEFSPKFVLGIKLDN